MAFGTLSIFDTIGGRRAAANDYIGLYDPQTLYEQLQVYLQTHNTLWDELNSDLLEPTQERFLTWGSNDEVQMQEGDEFSRPDVQKVSVSPTMMGFPLRIKQAAYGVTQLFMETKTIGDLEQVVTAVTDADVRQRLADVRAALFNPTNNLTYKDRFVDNITLPLRALLNADGAYIKPDAFGNTFNPSTHTHYSAVASAGNPAASELQALITNVVEHYRNGSVRVYIDRGSEATVRAFSGFNPYWDARITPSVNQNNALGVPLDVLDIYNRAIGIFGQAEVWIKPWVPAGYWFAFNTAAPKPLRIRTRPTAGTSRGILRIAAQNASYPLQATYMEREYGIGVYERTNGACLDCNHTTYQAPSAWSL
jgi:hypothetical protein